LSDARVIFDRVWKKFRRGERHDSLRDLIPAALGRVLGRRVDERELGRGDFWAVRDLSFEVTPGQTLGIIGPNGSGKSTTLKLLTRIYEPTRGYSRIHGRVGTLIEVSAGFHGDLTGRENIYLQGAIMGMRSSDITRRFDEIVEFSGISEFIDTPVKRYSSGMNARLGFSIAAHLEPDVLIIDEVLAVGDMRFQERAFGRIRELARSGLPVVMVSHQLDRVAELCTDVIVLRAGEVAARGAPGDAIAAYVEQSEHARSAIASDLIAFDSLEVTTPVVRSGERISVRVTGRVTGPLNEHAEPLAIRVRSLRSGGVVYISGTRRLDVSLGELGPFEVDLSLQANLPAGNYMLEAGAQDVLTHRDFATAPSALFRVTDEGTFRGTVQLNATMQIVESGVRSQIGAGD
jgi:ABC-type polysaccharide/polyol phosphate transport system ATPase subunit